MQAIYTLRSLTNELRFYESHLEGEFIDHAVVGFLGARFFCLLYSEIEAVEISETPDGQMIVLEINYKAKPTPEKKHLHPSNLFFRQQQADAFLRCQKAKALIEFLRDHPFDKELVHEILEKDSLPDEGKLQG